MEAIHNKYKSVFEKIQTISLCLFAGTLCYRRDVNQVFLIIALFSSLFLFDLNLLRINLKPMLCAIFVYLIAIVSSFYSPHKSDALFVLEKQLSILLLPMFLSFSFKASKEKLRLILWSFNLSLFAASLYLVIHFSVLYIEFRNRLPLQEFLNFQIHHFFSAPLKLHATYLSMYICFGIALTLYNLFTERTPLKVISLFFIPIYLFCLVILSSRIVLVPFLIILFLVLPFYIKKRSLVIYLVTMFTLMTGTILYLSNFTAFKDRFKTDTLRELNINEKDKKIFKFNDINTNDATRAERWKCSLELIREKPLIGFGTGEEKIKLGEKYIKYNLSHSLQSNFDAHNQYLAFTIKSGFIGLLAFLLLLINSFYLGIKMKSFPFIAFLLIISITSLTENILESNKGILFFSLFNSVFLFSHSALRNGRNTDKHNTKFN